MRAALGGVLFARPELLLLDEPTNYLDLEGAAWLEVYLRKYPHTVVVVSHDRDLLNRSVTHILAVEQTKLVLNAGGYDAYLKRRAERTAHLQAQKEKQDVQRAHMQSFIDRFKAKASKARQAQSRMKMLEKMTEITVPLAERTIPFKFDEPGRAGLTDPGTRQGRYGLRRRQAVLTRVSLRLDMDDRIAIVGANGQGKTTLVKSIAQRLPLMAGPAPRVEESAGRLFQPGPARRTARRRERARPREGPGAAAPARRRCGPLPAQFGFGAEKCETKVDKLSGGEKVRLLMGLTTWKKPHILILDEPTSHLDIDSREALIYALNEFKGAVLIITHDTYLAEATADRLWLVKDGKAEPYDGDLADYKALVLAADRPDETCSAAVARADVQAAEKPKSAAPAKATVQAEAPPRDRREGSRKGARCARTARPRPRRSRHLHAQGRRGSQAQGAREAAVAARRRRSRMAGSARSGRGEGLGAATSTAAATAAAATAAAAAAALGAAHHCVAAAEALALPPWNWLAIEAASSVVAGEVLAGDACRAVLPTPCSFS